MAKITSDETRLCAELARLELSDAEVARLSSELDAILGYMARLDAVDVSGVEPMTHAVPLDLPLADDALGPALGASDALAAAPRPREGYFEVPKIIEGAE